MQVARCSRLAGLAAVVEGFVAAAAGYESGVVLCVPPNGVMSMEWLSLYISSEVNKVEARLQFCVS